MKLWGYLFALLLSTPGLLLLLLELLRHGAYFNAVSHGAVLLGGVLLLVYVRFAPARLRQAEWIFAGLLTFSATHFLILYAQQPEQVLTYRLLGEVLLFIVTGLLLVLPSQMSIPLAVGLMLVYRLEGPLSGLPEVQLRLSQWVNTGMLALLMVGVVMRQTLTRLNVRLNLLEELSKRDTLTNLLNRRGFEQQAAALRAGGRGGTLIVLDVDDFKQVNDTHGHLTGDELLIELGRTLVKAAAPQGIAARWGGEEFALYLPDTSQLQGEKVAETLRIKVMQGALPVPITLSLGVTLWQATENLHAAFIRADNAMYTAKRSGKNRTLTAADPAPAAE